METELNTVWVELPTGLVIEVAADLAPNYLATGSRLAVRSERRAGPAGHYRVLRDWSTGNVVGQYLESLGGVL
jgi:hypothetical protein